MSARTFEDSGLGKAPFKFIGIHMNPPKSLMETNPEAWNAAVRNTPQLSLGRSTWTCAHCGTCITQAFIIKSADGFTSAVGETCINKLARTNKEGAFDDVVKAVKREKARKRREKADKEYSEVIKWWREMFMDNEPNQNLFKAHPSPVAWRAEKGDTLWDYYSNCFGWSGLSGKKRWKKTIEEKFQELKQR